MLDWFIRIVLAVLGILTAFPVLSLFNPADLQTRYGLNELDAVAQTLLRHRGILQLLLGASLVWAAFSPGVRLPVILAVVLSKMSFILLVQSTPEAQNSLTAGIQRFDLTSTVLLLLALVAHFVRRSAVRAAEG